MAVNHSKCFSFLVTKAEVEKLNLTHLKGLPYMRANCMAECRQVNSKQYAFDDDLHVFSFLGSYDEILWLCSWISHASR